MMDEVTGKIIGAAMKVHSALGPGLLESSYESCLIHELEERNMNVKSQVVLPVIYKRIRMDVGYRCDLVVEERVIVEIKSVETVLPLHRAQMVSYLKLSGMKVGLLINFNSVRLKDGITRLVNGL